MGGAAREIINSLIPSRKHKRKKGMDTLLLRGGGGETLRENVKGDARR